MVRHCGAVSAIAAHGFAMPISPETPGCQLERAGSEQVEYLATITGRFDPNAPTGVGLRLAFWTHALSRTDHFRRSGPKNFLFFFGPLSRGVFLWGGLGDPGRPASRFRLPGRSDSMVVVQLLVPPVAGWANSWPFRLGRHRPPNLLLSSRAATSARSVNHTAGRRSRRRRSLACHQPHYWSGSLLWAPAELGWQATARPAGPALEGRSDRRPIDGPLWHWVGRFRFLRRNHQPLSPVDLESGAYASAAALNPATAGGALPPLASGLQPLSLPPPPMTASGEAQFRARGRSLEASNGWQAPLHRTALSAPLAACSGLTEQLSRPRFQVMHFSLS